MWQPLVASVSLSVQVVSSTRTYVRLTSPFYCTCVDLTRRVKKVDAAADLGIPNVPRGEPGSTQDIPVLVTLESTKAEDLLGLTQVTPLKDMVAESVEDFRARGYPGFTA
jgi:hypothetical protein